MERYRGDNTTGFQSPAQDYLEEALDIGELLDLRRPGRYPVRVVGQALDARGIKDGDILVADAAADPRPGVVCIAMTNGDVILATLERSGESWTLTHSQGRVTEVDENVEVWAIVEALVRAHP